ncbi:MAG: aminoacyl-tRNA hydrolase [Candidatus Saccharimonas sp.]
MKIIFAQGNPGDQYRQSRHNVGFLALDAFAAKHEVTFASKARFSADIAELTIGEEKVILVRPTTFYNETGRSARAICDFYKCDPTTDLIVIHDDFALPFGTIRIRDKGSDAGNNGIKSINAALGQNYVRLRIGTYDALRDEIDDVDFVLGKFTATEAKLIKKTILPEAIQLIESFIGGRLELTTHVTLPKD